MSQSKAEIKWVSFLKGIAMLSIFFAHAPQGISWIDNKWTAWGANAVKLLLVIAGFLTTKSYMKRDYSNIEFLVKRFWRLAPLYWCMILFWHIIYIIDQSRSVTYFMTEHDAVAVLLNMTLLNGIFQHGNNTVVPGGWFVGAIFLFYIIAPTIIKGIERLWKKCPYLVEGIPVLCFVCLYVINCILMKTPSLCWVNNTFVIWYSVFFQLPSLLLGVNLWFELSDNKGGWKIGNVWLIICIFLLTVASWYSTYINYDFSQLAWGYLSYFLIILFATNYEVIGKFNICKMIEKFGNISYEFFLVHLFGTIVVLPFMARRLLIYTNEWVAYSVSLVLIFCITYFIAWGIYCCKRNLELNRKKCVFIVKETDYKN